MHWLRQVCERLQRFREWIDQAVKMALQEQLRQMVTAGSIDVNIMTKLDREHYIGERLLPYEFRDAAAALRGYANSNLYSTMVFSAGFNPNLYGYLTKFSDFFPDKNFNLKKKIDRQSSISCDP